MLLYFLLCCCLTALGLTFLRRKDVGGTPEPPSPSSSDAAVDEHAEEETKVVQIPFKPVDLSFHDTTYDVVASTSNETLRLLKSVNGVFRAGRYVNFWSSCTFLALFIWVSG